MPSAGDLQLIVLTTAGCTAAVVLAAAVVLGVWRSASIVSRFTVVVGTAVVSIGLSAVVIGAEMFFSPHDLTVLSWIVGVSAVMSLAAAWVVGRPVRQSLGRLRESARLVGDGQVVDAGRHGGRELAAVSAELAEASARLAAARAELEQLDASRRTFFAWISHDLRTPLTGVRALAEALDEGVAGDERQYIRRLRQQADAMSGLVDDLFELSRLQSGVLRPRREPVDVRDLVSDAVADVRPVAEARGVTVEHRLSGAAEVQADPRLLNRAIVNLLANAVRHAPPGSVVTAAARCEPQQVELAVLDRGSGVPEASLRDMFEVGWRGDAARSRDAGDAVSSGAGLGLAIVRAVAEAHGGSVSAGHDADGFRVSLVLPSTT
ncbi:sensor histidine kinase [Leifsonia sp. 2MCAF36]|uniref:sensor histidine kinase n=1 Tax=Leifsonia sp. 2MCAF36 TaxID=3232988 RepID=UPI003F9D6D6D